ncbi:glycosyltransferase family 2 protein [bacterium]|nr:glycosyltransferase family 2 protein [bacterium]
MADFTSFPSEADVVSHWRGPLDQPLVTLVCICFEHEPYVESTLKSFVEQISSFAFEIILYDDCSTDGTRSILREFAMRYPSITHLVLPDTNQLSQGKRPLFDLVLPHSRGRYVARLEGDDFWTDPSKIQQQVEFLEAHPEYALVTHDVATIESDGQMKDHKWLPDFYKRDFSREEVMLGWAGPTTQSVLFRNVIRDIPQEMRLSPSEDVFLGALLGKYGKCKYLPHISPSMYRHHSGGIFTSIPSAEQNHMQVCILFGLYCYYRRIGQHHQARVLKLRYLERVLRCTSLPEMLKILRVRLFGHPSRGIFRFHTSRQSLMVPKINRQKGVRATPSGH